MPNELPWLKVGDVEVANAAPTLAYMRTMASEKFEITCTLPGVLTRVSQCSGNLDPDTLLLPGDLLDPNCLFTTPGADGAPWYSASQPESAYFLGLLIDRIYGLEMTADRTVTPVLAGLQGGRVGQERLQPRTLRVEGTLVAARGRCDALDYGMRWLGEILGQSACEGCTLPSVEVRLAAPVPDDGSNDDEGHWIAYDVGLTNLDYPDNAPDPKSCDYQSVTFDLVAENPWFYKPPTALVAATAVNPGASSTATLPFEQWFCGGSACLSAAIPVPNIGVNASVVTVTGGSIDATGLSVYQGTPLYPSDSLYPSDCLYPMLETLAGTPSYPPPCPIIITIDTLPAGSEMIIDAARQRIVYIGPDGIERDGVSHLSIATGQAVRWMDTASCDQAQSVAVCAAGVCASDEQLTATIQYQHRER